MPISARRSAGRAPGSIRDLHLDGRGATYDQIYRALRCAILEGRAPAGLRLPSSRWLASDLGVSRNTVVAAYDQLLAEGYAVARVGAGTFVAPQLIEDRGSSHRQPVEHAEQVQAPARLSRFAARLAATEGRRFYDALDERPPVRLDFMPCVPGASARSTEAWRRCASRTLARDAAGPHRYADPSGLAVLRREIAHYLGRSRGVVCDPDDVAIVSGVAQVLDLCSRILLDEGDAVLLEDPHYIGARRAFSAAGARIVPATVDTDGLRLGAVPGRDLRACRLAYVTPSHQFPTGAVMSLGRRMELLAWARECDAYLIEDDYDSEFRYAGRSIEALKNLDASGRVIYTGTFSKVLDPGLRLAYVVLPRPLRAVFREAKWLADWASPGFEQEVLARFLAEGEFERHLRRMRTAYGRKREILLSAIEAEIGDAARVFDGRAGLHVMVELPGVPASGTRGLVNAVLARGVAIYDAAPYFERPPTTARLLLGFTLPDEASIRDGVRVLAEESRRAASGPGVNGADRNRV